MKEYIVDLESMIVEAEDDDDAYNIVQMMIIDGDVKIGRITENK